MRRLVNAFTLVELLVVLAIVSILAALLFPIFAGAKAAANRAACISNMKQVTASAHLYAGDYDDYFMLTSYVPTIHANSSNDRTWVQLLLPYSKSFSIFKCPGDNSTRPRPEATYDEDLVPGDTGSRYYSASMRTNYGFNYQYLSPIQLANGQWTAKPKPLSSVLNQSSTLMFLDSVWRRSGSGSPIGGGSWLVTPPCRYYDASGIRVDSFTDGVSAVPVFSTSEGWSEWTGASNLYGNAWPWHSGRLNMARVDGSVVNVSPSKLSEGCDLQQGWQGAIEDSASYLWDIR